MTITNNIAPLQSVSFWKNIWGNQSNRNLLWLALGLSLVEFVVFKFFYPYPDFFSDSYSYLFAAYANLDINIWPIGYSKFLRWFHAMTYSDTALVGFQYLLVQLSVLYFFFTLVYFYMLSRWSKLVLFIFLFLNPLSLYLCNTVNSDALFGALSLAWFTQLIWIIQRPKVYQLFLQAVLLFLCFTVRNNAYYYPIIAGIAYLYSSEKLWYKLAGIVLPFLLIIPFILHTRQKAYELTGTKQFSLFTGWQLANNALYIYDQVEIDSSIFTTQEVRDLNRLTIQYFRRINQNVYRNYIEWYVGNFFLRQPETPLKQYVSRHYRVGNEMENILVWGKASAIFKPFGKNIILRNPIPYIQYFVFPNTIHYFLPPLSHLDRYNYGTNKIDSIAQFWFHYPTNQIKCFSPEFQGEILIIYVALFLLFNVYFFWKTISIIITRGILKNITRLKSTCALVGGFIIINFLFSIVATVNILRYQFIPMIIILAFSLQIENILINPKLAKRQDKRKYVSPQTHSTLY